MDVLDLPAAYQTADDPSGRDAAWLRARWSAAREQARQAGPGGSLLVLDEVQKIPGWPDLVKLLWDEDTSSGIPLRVVLLGSAPLLVQQGLAQSLTGRFELLRVPHWSYSEMRDAFGWTVDQYVFFGGYPGAAAFIGDESRWRRYILDSLIETTVDRDILGMTRVNKPALLRRLLLLACEYSGQILSFNKMLGQLQDAGNTTTLAHYLDLLAGAGMVVGLQRYSGSKVRQRGSIPKLLALNTALVSAVSGRTFEEARGTPELWGRLVETAVGAHLVNGAWGADAEVFYWRKEPREVDYVLRSQAGITGIEVASGRKDSLPGMAALAREHGLERPLLVGSGGVPMDEFLGRPAHAWLA
jgi:predicted AAA+ superfamily ATPase